MTLIKIPAVSVGPSVQTSEIDDNAITLAKMAGGTDGELISYDANGDPVAVAVGTLGQVLKSAGAGAPPTFEDAASGASITFVNTEVYATANKASSFEDLDLSAVVGTNRALVLLLITDTSASGNNFVFRENGIADSLSASVESPGCSGCKVGVNNAGFIIVPTDSSGIVEWLATVATRTCTADVRAYIVI